MQKSKVKFPIQRFVAELAADTIDADQGTVDVIFYSGAAVRQFGWDGVYMLQFSMDPSAVRLGLLNSGAPLLDSHNDRSVKDQVGVVERAWLENGKGRATVRFSERAEVRPIWRDVQNKIIRQVSMRARMYRLKETTQEGDNERSFLATDWEPSEISLVPVGADPGAGVLLSADAESECEIEFSRATPENPKGETMQEELTPTGAVSPEVKLDAVRNEAVLAERRRAAEIRRAVKLAKLDDGFAVELIDSGKTVDQARIEVLNKLAANDEVVETRSHRAEVTRDEADIRRVGMTNALLHRYNPGKHQLDQGRDYHGMSLLRVAEECLAARGERTRGLGPMEIARLAFQSTSDFPNILAATAYKTMRDGYEAEPATFEPFCRRVSLPNFNTFNALAIGESFDFEKVGEAGEFKHGSLAESKDTYKLAPYGKIVAVTRQTIINDDLGAFTRIPEMHGRAARRVELDTVWAVITANAAMGDGTALFHANHSNLAAAGAAPSVTTLGAARKSVRLQKGVGGKARLNLRARFLLLPAALETTTDQLLTDITPAIVSNAVPAWVRGLTPIVEPRLDDNSTTAWYVAADPGQIDTIWYCYLQGQEGVFLETRQGFEVDGIELKARLDFGAAAIDYRGLYKDPGV